jgi:hypothetical protein
MRQGSDRSSWRIDRLVANAAWNIGIPFSALDARMAERVSHEMKQLVRAQPVRR